MLTVSQLKLPAEHTEDQLKKKILRSLGIQERELKSFEIRKRSLDARKKPDLFYVYTVDCDVRNEERALKQSKGKAKRAQEKKYCLPEHGERSAGARAEGRCGAVLGDRHS